jgi:ABC-type proline/glycine betaine transport system permease subunit
MKFKNKYNQLLLNTYSLKSMLLFYFAMFIAYQNKYDLVSFALFCFLIIFTCDAWDLIERTYRLYKQEKKLHD